MFVLRLRVEPAACRLSSAISQLSREETTPKPSIQARAKEEEEEEEVYSPSPPRGNFGRAISFGKFLARLDNPNFQKLANFAKFSQCR